MLMFRGDTSQVYRLLYAPPPVADARPAPLPDIGAMIAAARQRAPGTDPRQIVVSHWGRRDMQVSVSSARAGFIGIQDKVVFDAAGNTVSEQHPADQVIGTQILGALGPLHFGWFGGSAIRVVYGMLGLALCVVTASGINVWLSRRRDKGRAAPALERVWSAIAWGQPFVLGLTALISLIANPRLLVVLWVAATIVLLTASPALTRRRHDQITAWLQGATALVLCALSVVAVSLRPVSSDGASVQITVVILVVGLVFGFAAWRYATGCRAASAG